MILWKRCEEMRIHSSVLKKILMIVAIVCTVSSTCFAAWWATPGYEWGLSKGLTSVKSQAQLEKSVSHTDLYATILKYLKMKGVQPSGRTIHHNDDMEDLNNVVAGVFNIVNSYTSKTELTPDQYRIVESYIDHGRDTFNKYSEYITKNSVKNIDLYLALSKYKAAKLINDREYREYVLAGMKNIKNTEILNYGIIPYAGDITRREFLLLMYSLLSSQNLSDATVIQQFNDAGVLIGYQSDLMLDKKLTYSEMLTFLHRFENFDFEPVEDEAEVVEK